VEARSRGLALDRLLERVIAVMPRETAERLGEARWQAEIVELAGRTLSAGA
jgi:hypothetical protein